MTHPRNERMDKRFRLPFGFFAGPAAWALQLIVGYGLAPVACKLQSSLPYYILSLISLALVIASGFVAYQSWRTYQRRNQPEIIDLDRQSTSSEFIASSGFLLSVLFFLLVLATGVAAFFLNPCPLLSMPFP